MPLSKRINNLHINSNLSLEADSSRLVCLPHQASLFHW
jgi:hypothetical protein